MIAGCDLSPEYQPRFDVHAAHAQGIRFIAVKLSDSAKGTERYEDGIRVLRTAHTLGMVGLGYHFMRADAGIERDAEMFAAQLRRAGVPGVIDWEEHGVPGGGGFARPSIDQLRDLTGAVWATGARLAFTYAPRWYWNKQSQPSLAGLPPLWASRYVTVPDSKPAVHATGTWTELAALIDPAWWDGYGGKPVRLLQFTSKATIAGFVMDADIYPGTLPELEAEVHGP
jgi:lysozyme